MATARTQRWRRRQWLVNRPLQFRFVKATVFILLLMAISAVAAVYLAVWITLSSFELTQDALIMSLLNTICWTIMLELLVLTPIVIWVAIRLSHKVAGPLVRIRSALTQMCAGEFDVHIGLRKGDELAELAELTNRLAASLRQRRSS